MGLLTVLGVVLTVGCALAIGIVLELKAGDISTVTFTARLPLLASCSVRVVPRPVSAELPVASSRSVSVSRTASTAGGEGLLWPESCRSGDLLVPYAAFDSFKNSRKSLILWCRCADSNRGPTDYESVALPTELHRHGQGERSIQNLLSNKRKWTIPRRFVRSSLEHICLGAAKRHGFRAEIWFRGVRNAELAPAEGSVIWCGRSPSSAPCECALCAALGIPRPSRALRGRVFRLRA